MKKADKNKAIGISLLLGVLLLGGLIFYFAVENAQNVPFTEPTIWTVEYGRLECLEDTREVYDSTFVDDKETLTCGKNFLVDDCRIQARCGDTTFVSPNCGGAYKVNDGSWITYKLSEYENRILTTVQAGDEIEFATGAFSNIAGFGWPTNADETQIRAIYNPYKLYTFESGAKILSNSNNCRLADQTELTRKDIEYGQWDELQKNTWRNYFYGWQETMGLAVYNYNSQQAICSLSSLYALESEKLADGTTRLIQGDAIKNVDCCPHQDDNCDSNFEWIPEPQEKECSYDYQCNNAGMASGINDETASQESCINNKCVPETFNIECNSDQKCISLYGNGYFCDLRQVNFGNCYKGTGGQTCGDGECQTGETFDSCPADCEDYGLTCKWYQVEGTKTVYKYSVLGVRLGAEEVAACRIAGWLLTLIIIGSVLGTLTLALGSFFVIKKIGTIK